MITLIYFRPFLSPIPGLSSRIFHLYFHFRLITFVTRLFFIKPGFDFLEAMALHYPQISMDWLLTGRGRMYKDAPVENPVFAAAQAPRRVSKILVFYDDNTFEEFQ